MKIFKQISKAIQFFIKPFVGQSPHQTKAQQTQFPNINIYITNNQGETKKEK